MVDPRIKLYVYHDDNAAFSDYSDEACDFSRDTITMSLNKDEDYLYVGFTKPFHAIFVELSTANTNANSLAAQYYNGTTWTTLVRRDETKGFTRSGFITWDSDGMESTTVNSQAAYWIRLRPNVTHSSTIIAGINLVFCDDNKLKEEIYQITDSAFLPSGQASHILAHVGARNAIIQELRNRGEIKYNDDTGEENITQWDLLDVFEIQEAAKYKALSLIFFGLADSADDSWYQKHLTYEDKYQSTLKGLKLTVDKDDDGVKDDAEKLTPVRISRWVY